MSTLVINRDSLSLRLEGHHLVVHDHADEGSSHRVPLVDVDRVIVVGNPAISFHTLAHLMDRRIPCSFLTHGGKWRGLMDGDPGFHADRRRRQYARLDDPAFSLQLARQLASAKIANSRRTLQRLATERQMSLIGDDGWRMLTELGGEVPAAATLDAVRGVEGRAANVYFRLLARFFPEDVPFERRSRRPPRNQANALLSFVYVLLSGVFTSAVRAHGLDVAGGFLHRGSDRSPALALDLMEPFRPAWADRLVLDLLNHRRMRADEHFEGSPSEGVYLTGEGRRIVFMAFDEMMERRNDTEGGKATLRQIVDWEVCHFIEALEGTKGMRFYHAA